MPIVRLEDRDTERLDAFLRGRSDTLFYASGAFRGFLRALLGATDHSLGWISDTGELAAALPALVSAPGAWGPVLNSLPYYGSNGGVIGAEHDPVARSALLAEFLGAAATRGCASATLISSPFDPPEALELYSSAFRPDAVDERIGQVTMLPDTEDALEQLLSRGFHLMVRRAVAKGRRLGLEIRQPDADGLEFLRGVHEENMAAIGGLAKSRAFFESVPRAFAAGREYRVYAALVKGEPVAALLLFYFNRTVEYYTPAIRAEFRSLQPLSLIIFEAMRDAVRAGFSRWNWGGTWRTQQGVYDFKRRWAAVDLPYRYFVKILEPRLRSARKDELLAAYPGFYVLPFDQLSRQ